jgi:hypothetical protein
MNANQVRLFRTKLQEGSDDRGEDKISSIKTELSLTKDGSNLCSHGSAEKI